MIPVVELTEYQEDMSSKESIARKSTSSLEGFGNANVGMFLTVRLTAKQTMSRFTWARLAH